MKKALLVGNGFTLYLINAYKNQPMMAEFYKSVPDMVDRIQKDFNTFRNLDFNSNDLYTVSEALFCGDNVFPSDNLYPSDDEIQITNKAKYWVLEKLKGLDFPEPESTYDSFFQTYGLIYSINTERIVGIESYLKVVALFEIIGRYTKDEYNELKLIANEVYYNHGNHGRTSIDNPSIDVAKLEVFLNEFEDIFTTNYDTVIDDILEPHGRLPYHLHGGFSINHKNKDPDGRYSPTEAKLIWGINAEEKFNELKQGFSWSDFRWDAFTWGDSQISKYFDYLRDREYDEIHILGFSGENDDHINKRIIENPHVMKVFWYVDPDDINNIETQVKSRLLFSGEKKIVNLRKWTDFWDKVSL